MAERKIKVLVIPDLFPEDGKDVKGIFVADYLRATSPHCDNTVLVMKLSGRRKGIAKERAYDADIIRYTLSEQIIPSFSKPYYYYRFFGKALELAGELEKPDIIHAHGAILGGSIAWKLSQKWKIPFVVTEHAGPITVITGNSWKYRWTKFIVERCQALLNVSRHAEREILNAGMKPHRSFVTYNPVDTGLFAPAAAREKKFLFAARLDAFKGAMTVLKIFARLPAKEQGWRFVIVGDGEEMPAIREFLKQNPVLENKIDLKGWLTKKELAQEMASSCFFVFPSHHETFGLVAAEAVSCGIPVITGNKTAMTEYIHDGNGLLVDAKSEREIEAALIRMFDKHSAFEANRMREEIVQRFGFASFGQRLKEIYVSVISNFSN